MESFFLYLLIINACAFTLMLEDKRNAREKLWRIPEATLLTVAVLGGSIGVWAGMYLIRHKTRHLKFALGIPAILLAQLAACFLFHQFL